MYSDRRCHKYNSLYSNQYNSNSNATWIFQSQSTFVMSKFNISPLFTLKYQLQKIAQKQLDVLSGWLQPMIQPSRSTRAFLFLPNTASPKEVNLHGSALQTVTSSLKFADRSIAIAVPPLCNNSRQHYNNYQTHPINSPRPHPVQSLNSSFTPNLKHCSSISPSLTCPSFSLPPSPFQLQTPSTIAV